LPQPPISGVQTQRSSGLGFQRQRGQKISILDVAAPPLEFEDILARAPGTGNGAANLKSYTLAHAVHADARRVQSDPAARRL
jgi:hypothetical protein